MFFSSLKLQYCRTIVLLNFLKKPLFKSDDGHAISRREKRRLPKSTARFPATKKKSILQPPSACLATPLPLPQSLYGRTLTSQPKFLGWIDYEISLAMVLRWRASARAPLQERSFRKTIESVASVLA